MESNFWGLGKVFAVTAIKVVSRAFGGEILALYYFVYNLCATCAHNESIVSLSYQYGQFIPFS